MPRGVEREPGIKKLPNVPYRAGQMGPNMNDTDTARGEFCYVPREPLNRCMDFGGEPTGRGSLGARASATYTRGKPTDQASVKDTRIMPESQLDGSYNVMGGNGAPITSQQRKGIKLGGQSEE